MILPMDALRVTEQVTPEGISHTMEYIEKTKKGEMKKREPLSVVERGDGTYSIIDGNQSYSALKQLGAKNIPVIVASRPSNRGSSRWTASFGSWKKTIGRSRWNRWGNTCRMSPACGSSVPLSMIFTG